VNPEKVRSKDHIDLTFTFARLQDIHIYEKPPLRIDTLGAAATVLTHNVLDCLREFKGEGNENNTLFGMGYV